MTIPRFRWLSIIPPALCEHLQEAGGFLLNIFAWVFTAVAAVVGAWQAFWVREQRGLGSPVPADMSSAGHEYKDFQPLMITNPIGQ